MISISFFFIWSLLLTSLLQGGFCLCQVSAMDGVRDKVKLMAAALNLGPKRTKQLMKQGMPIDSGTAAAKDWRAVNVKKWVRTHLPSSKFPVVSANQPQSSFAQPRHNSHAERGA